MAENSKIEWTHHTFNPWMGCTKVSPGCAHCYAETLMDTRHHKVQWGKGKPRVRTGAANWREPYKWNKQALAAGGRHRVFCASLADVFDDEVPINWLQDLLQVIDDNKQLDWLLLTKRPQNIYMRMNEAMNGNFEPSKTFREHMPHVWLGTSAENQECWNERVGMLKIIRARVHFVSSEPLLGPIQIGDVQPDWLIVGGESGRGARPIEAQWVTSLRDQCIERDIAFHFKQWGGENKKLTGRELEGRTWDQMPTCPKCGDTGLQTLTFKAHPGFIGQGCWNCDWMIAPSVSSRPRRSPCC